MKDLKKKMKQPKHCGDLEKCSKNMLLADEMLLKIKKRRDYHHTKFSLKKFPYGNKELIDNTINYLQNFAPWFGQDFVYIKLTVDELKNTLNGKPNEQGVYSITSSVQNMIQKFLKNVGGNGIGDIKNDKKTLKLDTVVQMMSAVTDSIKYSANSCTEEGLWRVLTDPTNQEPSSLHKAVDNIKTTWKNQYDPGFTVDELVQELLMTHSGEGRLPVGITIDLNEEQEKEYAEFVKQGYIIVNDKKL